MNEYLNERRREYLFKGILSVIILLALFLAIESIAALKGIKYIGKDTQPNFVTINGTGEITAVPDTATFSYSIVESAPLQKDALDASSKKTNAILSAIKALGISDADVQTTNYSLNPKYDYTGSYCTNGYCPQGKQTLTGYEVNQTITVKVRKTADAGAILAKVTELGATNVSGLNFVIDNMDKVNAQARDKAIANAKSKASTLSNSLGVPLTKIVNFTENSAQPPMMYGLQAMGSKVMAPDAATVPQVPTGENKITSNVTLTYEIE